MKKRLLCLALALSAVSSLPAAELLAHLKLGTPKPTAQALLNAVHAICPLPFIEMKAAALLQPYGYPAFDNLSSETGPGWLLLNINGAPRTVAALKLSPAAAQSPAALPGMLRTGDWMLSCRDKLPDAERDAVLKAAVEYLNVLESPIPSLARLRLYPAFFEWATVHMQKAFPADHVKTSAQFAGALSAYFKTIAYVDTDISVSANSLDLSNTVRAVPNTALARFLANQKGGEVPQAAYLSRDDHSVGAIARVHPADTQRIVVRLIELVSSFYPPEQVAQMQDTMRSLLQKYADSDGTQALLMSVGKHSTGNIQTIANENISMETLVQSYAEANAFTQFLLSAISDQVKVQMTARLMEGAPAILECETKTIVPQEVPTQASLEKYRALVEKDPNADADGVLQYETVSHSEQALSYVGVTSGYMVQAPKAEEARALLGRVAAKKPAESPLSALTGTTLPDGYFTKGVIMLPRFLQEIDAAVHDEEVTTLGLKLNSLNADSVPPATFAVYAKGDALNSTLSVPLESLARITSVFLSAAMPEPPAQTH